MKIKRISRQIIIFLVPCFFLVVLSYSNTLAYTNQKTASQFTFHLDFGVRKSHPSDSSLSSQEDDVESISEEGNFELEISNHKMTTHAEVKLVGTLSNFTFYITNPPKQVTDVNFEPQGACVKEEREIITIYCSGSVTNFIVRWKYHEDIPKGVSDFALALGLDNYNIMPHDITLNLFYPCSLRFMDSTVPPELQESHAKNNQLRWLGSNLKRFVTTVSFAQVVGYDLPSKEITKITDGICLRVVNKDDIYIAVADLNNSDVKVELLHDLAEPDQGLFYQKTVKEFVSQHLTGGNGRSIPAYHAAINGTAFLSDAINRLSTTYSSNSILGIDKITYGENGRGVEKNAKDFIDQPRASFFAYSEPNTNRTEVIRNGMVHRASVDFQISDRDSARTYIQNQINVSDFVVGYQRTILDQEYVQGKSDSSPKTAIGVSRDGKRIYIATSTFFKSSQDMAEALKESGAHRAILLDGGGSPQFSSYSESDTPVNYSAPNSSRFLLPRRVINSIAVYNSTKSTTKSIEVPLSGGAYQLSAQTSVEFRPGTFGEEVNITYMPQFAPASYAFRHVKRFYGIQATNLNGSLVQPNQPYKMTVTYDEQNVPDGFREADLGLYFWNGNKWEKEPTSVIDVVNNKVTANPNHFTQWAILFPVTEVYLPIVITIR